MTNVTKALSDCTWEQGHWHRHFHHAVCKQICMWQTTQEISRHVPAHVAEIALPTFLIICG